MDNLRLCRSLFSCKIHRFLSVFSALSRRVWLSPASLRRLCSLVGHLMTLAVPTSGTFSASFPWANFRHSFTFSWRRFCSCATSSSAPEVLPSSFHATSAAAWQTSINPRSTWTSTPFPSFSSVVCRTTPMTSSPASCRVPSLCTFHPNPSRVLTTSRGHPLRPPRPIKVAIAPNGEASCPWNILEPRGCAGRSWRSGEQVPLPDKNR